MNSIIDELISQKPHLADPLRFYKKVQGFLDAVRALELPVRPELNAYPPEFVSPITGMLSSMLELPEGSLSPLKQALELGEIDFTRLPLREIPAFSLPYSEDDLTMLLFHVSKPYFLRLREACRLDHRSWDEGRCPLCNAQPSLSTLDGDGRRELSCSFCGTVGSFRRVQCPVCLNLEPEKLNIFTFAGEEGFSVQTCDACRSYIKTADGTLRVRVSPDLADLMSLPLDIVIQQKGFSRRSPNPIGMVKMSANG
ncbi:MAG: formate dehydrogenase accessory protein FdhE [Betaproteobacteria bacterium]